MTWTYDPDLGRVLGPDNGGCMVRKATLNEDGTITPHGGTKEEIEANGYLIAAAPDMYKALERLLKNYHLRDIYRDECCDMEAEAALRKACGES